MSRTPPILRTMAGAAALALLGACTDQDGGLVGVQPPGGGPSLEVAGSTRTDLGTLGGTTSTAYGITAAGQVVGTSKMGDGSTRAFSWTAGGGMVALPAGSTHAYGVNSAGVIVGRGVFGGSTRGFVWTPGAGGGTLQQLPLGVPGTSSGEARAINDAGQIVGFSTGSGIPRAVLWTPNGAGGYQVTLLGDFGGGQGQALDINAHGTVVGWAATPAGEHQAFRWDPTAANSPTGTLHALPSGTRNEVTDDWYPSEAHAINDSGQIAGWNRNGWHGSFRMPARWDPGAARPVFMGRADLHFRAFGEARGLNVNGSLLAGFYDGRAFAWHPGSDPLELSAPAGTAQAFDVAADGTVVGWAGGTAAIWRNIVSNSPPVAVHGGPYYVNPGDTVLLDGRASYDVDLDSLTYTWMVGATFYPGATYSFTQATVGRRTLWLIVTDDDGKADTAYTDVFVNTKPIAAIAGADSLYVAEGSSVHLDGSASHDPDGNPLTYAWTFGDGTVEDDATVNKTYRDDGVFTARLIITDSWSRADTASVTVFVSNVAPRATFAKGAGLEGTARTLSLVNVIEPSTPDRDSLEYAFDCGSGFGPYGSTPSRVCPAIPDQDTVVVRARLRDKDGGVSTYTRNQYIANVLPGVTASASATTVNVGDLVTIAAGSAFTDPGADSPWTWTYAWGDGAVSRGGTSTQSLPPSGHRYMAPGTYTLQVSVRDDRGFGHAAPITITVNP